VGTHVVVVAGGDPPTTFSLPDGAWIIAADSGVDIAYGLGWTPDVAIGDFDSVTPVGLARARRDGVEIIEHPAAKDETDIELALREAIHRGATEVTVVALGGGRLDHFLANVLALGAGDLASARVSAVTDTAKVVVVRGGDPPVPLEGVPGDLVTLLPVGGPAAGIVTSGLLYPLDHDTLPAGTSRGVSNVVTSVPATVALEAGTLLAITPRQGDAHA
jgi:thiamine pyrophosphokinase